MLSARDPQVQLDPLIVEESSTLRRKRTALRSNCPNILLTERRVSGGRRRIRRYPFPSDPTLVPDADGVLKLPSPCRYNKLNISYDAGHGCTHKLAMPWDRVATP